MGEALKCSPLTCQECYCIWQPRHFFRKKPSSPVCRQKGTLNNFSQRSVPFPFPPPRLGKRGAFAVPRPSIFSDTSRIDRRWGSILNQWGFRHWPAFFLNRCSLHRTPSGLSQPHPSKWRILLTKQYPERSVLLLQALGTTSHVWQLMHMCSFWHEHGSQRVKGPPGLS